MRANQVIKKSRVAVISRRENDEFCRTNSKLIRKCVNKSNLAVLRTGRNLREESVPHFETRQSRTFHLSLLNTLHAGKLLSDGGHFDERIFSAPCKRIPRVDLCKCSNR